MRSPWIAAVLLVALWSPASLVAEEGRPPPEASWADGEHFRVVCHFGDEEIAAIGLEAAEAAFEPTRALLNAPEIEGRLAVNVYRTAADYRDAVKDAGGKAFLNNNAFTSYKTRAAYVAVVPDIPDAVLEKVGLSAQTRRIIAHEAVHVVTYRAWPNYRRVPEWLHEGLATYVADQAMLARGWSPGLAQAPYSSTRMARLGRLRDSGRLPRVRAILQDRYKGLEMSEKYASWWGFFRFLKSEHPDKLAYVLARAGAEPEKGATSAEFFEALEKAWTRDGIEALDRDFLAWIPSLKPEWDERYRTLTVDGKRWIQLAWPKRNAVCWRTAPVGRKRYEIRGAFEILPCEEPQLNLLLGRSKRGFVSVALRAGNVTVFDYESSKDRWNRLGNAKVESLVAEKKFRFRASVKDDRLRIVLDGKKRLEVSTVEACLEATQLAIAVYCSAEASTLT